MNPGKSASQPSEEKKRHGRLKQHETTQENHCVKGTRFTAFLLVPDCAPKLKTLQRWQNPFAFCFKNAQNARDRSGAMTLLYVMSFGWISTHVPSSCAQERIGFRRRRHSGCVAL